MIMSIDYIGTMVMMVINDDHDNDGKFGDGKQIPTIFTLPLFTVPVIYDDGDYEHSIQSDRKNEKFPSLSLPLCC